MNDEKLIDLFYPDMLLSELHLIVYIFFGSLTDMWTRCTQN